MWEDVTEYNPDDKCSICLMEYGTDQAIFKTPCNHQFHNNCLNEYCERHSGRVVCPICRSDLGHSCMNVWAFKEKTLGSSDGTPLFRGSKHILNIYNNKNPPHKKGGKKYRTKRTKKMRTKRTKRTKKMRTKRMKQSNKTKTRK